MIRYASFRGGIVRYSDKGKGRAIVLLHGYPENLHIWDEFSDTLSKNFRVIGIDLPGFGETENFGYVHSMELMAQCVHSVMLQLNLRRYIVVGHSMGGYVAIAFAELFTENLRGLCMFHSTTYPDTEEKKADRDRGIVAVKKHPAQYLKAFSANLFADPNDTHIKKVQEIISTSTPRGIIAALEGMKVRPNREIILKFTRYPVLFIMGKKDKIINYQAALPQTEIPSQCEVLLLENAGHMGFYEAPEETLKALGKFAKRCFRERKR
ncbi:MAG TPA: alpha/beta hydrolase [Bacteroidia bacterium]|jgi:pimeloyl-ACP methyl ester carboxylesterase|nr:alpha/beta hydrolase [Bacteroidia bacterium]